MYLAQQCWSLKRGFILTHVHWELETASCLFFFHTALLRIWTLFPLSKCISHPENASHNILLALWHGAASDDRTRRSTPCQTESWRGCLWDVFPRSQIVPLHFITVRSLLCRRVCGAVIGSRWGGPCVPPWWCQPWLREKHGGLGMESGTGWWGWWENVVSQNVYEAKWLSAGLQVSGMEATPTVERSDVHAQSNGSQRIKINHWKGLIKHLKAKRKEELVFFLQNI